MNRESITPTSEAHWHELRSKDLTSTDIAALFNISPYLTEFELWHRKKDGYSVSIEINDRMKWGIRLQDAIAKGIAEEHSWAIRHMAEYIRIPDLRLGSSFDYFIVDKAALLEIKNVDSFAFNEGWIFDRDYLEAPAYIELQTQHQMLVSGYEVDYIGALVGGNNLKLIRRVADKYIQNAIIEKSINFWKSIDSNTPPSPNYEKDSAFISKLYSYAEPGKIYDAENDSTIESLVKKYKDAAEISKKADLEKDAAKAEILKIIGDCEKVTSPIFSISAGVVAETPVSYIRKAYRDFRIFNKNVANK